MTEYTDIEKAYITKQMLRDIIENPDNCLAIKDTFYVENLLKKKRGTLAKSDKLYPTDEFYHYLYGCILESDVEFDSKYKEILLPLLKEALMEHGMTEEDWQEIKTRKMTTKWFKNIVDSYCEHPVQIQLLSDANTSKTDLYAEGTVNKNARKVIKVKRNKASKDSLAERVKRLEEAMQELKELPNRVENLEHNLNEIRNEDYKRIAYLYIKGLTNAEIESFTGFHPRKVQRGIQQYKRLLIL